ncbi:MAG: cytoplasmic protein, partial [Desulfuromonas sp.]
MKRLDRRTFIRRSLTATLAMTTAGSLPVFDLLALPALAATQPPLAVRKGSAITTLVQEAISALGGMSSFVKSGETV